MQPSARLAAVGKVAEACVVSPALKRLGERGSAPPIDVHTNASDSKASNSRILAALASLSSSDGVSLLLVPAGERRADGKVIEAAGLVG